MKISFITTVFNEYKSINNFLDSLLFQTKLPDEVVVVDGGSRDSTELRIKNYEVRFKKKKVIFIFLIKKGNRSIGRNEAIKKSSGEIIACSDAGNILDKKWLENITKPFKDKKIDVVAGYYKAKVLSIFQKCLIPYVLVMPDRINPKNFLPATRSMAFKKSIWEKAGGFDESLSNNEDYAFANKLKMIGAKIIFAKDAIVNWLPRNTYTQAFVMFFRFALGDIESGIIRLKVLLLFIRYLLGLFLLVLCLQFNSIQGFMVLALILIAYLIWAVYKNYKYVNNIKGFIILPIIQLTADAAVLAGSIAGIFSYLKKH